MKNLKTLAIVVCAIGLAGTALLAHQVTYKGTVVAADKATVKVTVVDEKTKKPAQITFKVDKDTKTLRGDTVIAFADARIQKDEKIAVTVDHDLDEDLALVIRLDSRKQ